MAGQSTNVTVSNIIIGPCTSFQVDGNELGGTSGGVQVEKKQTTVDIEIDQVAGVVKKGLKQESYSVKTSLSEATLANLQIAWGLSQAPTTDTQTQTTTLNLGAQTGVIEHTLSFVGPAPNGKQRTYTITRAVAMVSGAHTIDKSKEVLIPVEFDCLPDLTQTGAEYGTIQDK